MKECGHDPYWNPNGYACMACTVHELRAKMDHNMSVQMQEDADHDQLVHMLDMEIGRLNGEINRLKGNAADAPLLPCESISYTSSICKVCGDEGHWLNESVCPCCDGAPEALDEEDEE